ncbi:threonine synthase-like 1 [Watersipora subatra]|uniref:threonine synthase-like 1 n=1 Tax=Watersipora subatra TaxID=2589382 RepID=UPI00355B75B3
MLRLFKRRVLYSACFSLPKRSWLLSYEPVHHHCSNHPTSSALYSTHKTFLKTTQNRRDNNILLLGSPGAGKTTIAQQIAEELDMKVFDVDDHLLEPTWQMSVAEKLAEVGGKRFLELEAKAFMTFKTSDSIISLTGSQPMNDDAMSHARKLGTLVYLDVLDEDILERLARMKVARIVGQEEGQDMRTILKYRQQFYEKHYDIRVICEPQDSVASISHKALEALKKYKENQGHTSTRTAGFSQSFLDVTLQGLAPDRGLYVSNDPVPAMNEGQWGRLVGVPYTDCALKVLEQWIQPSDIPRQELRHMVGKAYNHENFGHEDIAPVVPLEKNQYLLELFHGPTASFKDIPLQLMARIYDYAVKQRDDGLRSLILVATSGDTGGAVLDAFTKHTSQCEVVVLFPEDGVSEIQKAQLTGFKSPRSCIVGVKEDFDFCQTAVKDIFTNHKYNKKLRDLFGYSLSAANSINYARLLPQVVYHVWSYLLMVRDGHLDMGQQVDVCVPTGNFGNVLGAYYAKMMGIPIRHLVIVSNNNNVLTEFFSSGVYDISERKLLTTSSPAIDILKSSNLERFLFSVSGGDNSLMNQLFSSLETSGKFSVAHDLSLIEKIQSEIKADWCIDEDSLKTMKDVHRRTGYLLDPHTAVAKTVADRMALGSEVPVIISATAHYSKFSETVLKAHNVSVDSSSGPRELMKMALKLADLPDMHGRLWKDIQNSRHHTMVCEGNQKVIKHSIEEFLTDYAVPSISKY